ncbi:MAG: SAM-dependent methyltransferase, partial [Verrucomicrobia bacterium]
MDVFRLQTELVELIRAEIAKRGQVSFAWFMEQALYHCQQGYYSSGRAAIGRRGDYFTNVSVGPLFGQLLAAQFVQIWQRLGQIDNFIIAEQGAHHGDFARDVLDAIRNAQPACFEALRYRIVEPFPVLQDRQLQTLEKFADRVEWRRSPPDLEPFTGIHFSNELLDAMPVHLLVSTGDGWREKFVALEGDKFVFANQPIVDPALQAFVKKLPTRPAGYETEVNLVALDWIDHVAAKLERGHVLAFDYGFSRDEFYAPYRTAGTLQVREKHRQLPSAFEQIGHADITAHVSWTDLAERAESR